MFNSLLKSFRLPHIIITLIIVSFLLASGFTATNQSVLWIQSLLNFETLLSPNSEIIGSVQPINIPVISRSVPAPLVSAEAVTVIDRSSYTPLYEKSSDVRTYPASTTKIATAIIVLEQYQLDMLVTVPNDVYETASGSSMKLRPSDTLTVHDLITGMLISSGNDAAYTLASAYPSGVSGFIDEMNALITRLHLSDTSFVDAIGFDNRNQYTSPHDLALLADVALTHPLIQEIVSTKDATVYSQIDPQYAYTLHNTNMLLGSVPGVKGIKTGWTYAAQGVLVTYVTRDSHEIIVVVMRSTQREEDTKRLIEWTYDNYQW